MRIPAELIVHCISFMDMTLEEIVAVIRPICHLLDISVEIPEDGAVITIGDCVLGSNDLVTPLFSFILCRQLHPRSLVVSAYDYADIGHVHIYDRYDGISVGFPDYDVERHCRRDDGPRLLTDFIDYLEHFEGFNKKVLSVLVHDHFDLTMFEGYETLHVGLDSDSSTVIRVDAPRGVKHLEFMDFEGYPDENIDDIEAIISVPEKGEVVMRLYDVIDL